MQITKSKIQHLFPLVFALLGALVYVLMCGDVATAGYADSAHGDASSGVNRTGAGYDVGSCAHCHETFNNTTCGVNPLMLFDAASDETFCFKCHDGTNNVQDPAFSNDNYAKTFGGAPSADFTNVYDAFNADASGGSSHDLATLLSWVVTNHGEGCEEDWGFTLESNPCTICHNPHLDKRNSSFPQDPTYTAIRRPSEHASNPTNQWGDGTDERMDSSWSAYRSPYYKSVGSDGYEPGGTTSTDGSKHPDYAALCLDCHSVSVNGLDAVNWTQVEPQDWVGGIHGEEHFDWHPAMGDVKTPYPLNTDYVLSCLDCHEPHGSSNPRTLRTTMNGVSGLTYELENSALIQTWCEACHEYDSGMNPIHFGFRGGYCAGGPGYAPCHTHGGDYPN